MGNLRGWRQVLAEDFTSGRLPSRVGPLRRLRPGATRSAGGSATTSRSAARTCTWSADWQHGTFVTGGVMATAWPSTYGKYAVRFKVSRGRRAWPTRCCCGRRPAWPTAGEIDFAEDGGGPRHGMTATLHYGAGNTQLQRHVRADFTQFQTVGVEWTPGRIVYTLNGKPWATVVSPHVPRGPMRLAMQLEAGHGNPLVARAVPGHPRHCRHGDRLGGRLPPGLSDPAPRPQVQHRPVQHADPLPAQQRGVDPGVQRLGVLALAVPHPAHARSASSAGSRAP